jgi:glycosyltransferase involved in cell wall biosynthesis
MTPRVSILLPNLNNRPYLDERIRTITDQTFSDWELIIVDNYSDDGAWEFLRELAKTDSRIRISQAPRQGMYANWNNCIRLARGEYVYIATSDDTMSPKFLEIMINALDEHPGCDLAHCKLKIIDENGSPHPTLNWDKFYCTTYFGDLIHQKHIRLAPHDGLLHCGVKTVYTSITQLLIRKSLFEQIGLFLTNYGSIADFEWEMRASLVADTIHIPEYLATWRVHRDQGTDMGFLDSVEHRALMMELIDHALKAAKPFMPDHFPHVPRKQLKRFLLKEKFQIEVKEQKNKVNRYKIALKWLFTNPGILRDYRASKKSKKSFISSLEPLDFSRKILAEYGLDNNIKILKGYEKEI